MEPLLGVLMVVVLAGAANVLFWLFAVVCRAASDGWRLRRDR